MSRILFNETKPLNGLVKPSIRVLIYTDDPTRIREDGSFGIGELRKHLAARPPAFADIDLRPVVSRNSDASHHADHRINDELNEANQPYHEVWFFGMHQANKPKYKLDFPGGGGPYSELELDEVAALDYWMRVDLIDGSKGIGVLVSGDHANPPPNLPPILGSDPFCPRGVDHERFLSLGRALGKKIPRAGLLRKWEGPPTHCSEDSFNTLVPPFEEEVDRYPQQLFLPRFDQFGNPNSTGEPHQLFRGRNGEWLQVLPDHEHEGTVVLPSDFPQDIWPSNSFVQPLPRFIAHGYNRRTGYTLNILAAYNGDAVSRGRIISDSSWHHYLNANLENLSAAHLDRPAADQIGQFYSNLVVWLAPLAVRRAMANLMIVWLATHPSMMEEISAGPLNIGTLALRLARRVASECEIHELLAAACPEPLRKLYETLDFPHEPKKNALPSVEVLLGSIISKYFEAVGQDESPKISDAKLVSIIHQGFAHAFEINGLLAAGFAHNSLAMLLSFAPDRVSPEVTSTFRCLNSLHSSTQPQERLTTMSTNRTYTFVITRDRGGSENYTLDLEADSFGCQVFQPTGLLICPLTGSLHKEREQYNVRGTLFGGRVIHLTCLFKSVRLNMAGVILTNNNDFHVSWVAVSRDVPLGPDKLAATPVNPDVGDTGTGTSTQTFDSN